MNKSYFNKSFYGEAIRQTRLLGLVFMLISGVFGALFSIGTVVTTIIKNSTTHDPISRLLNFTDINPLGYLAIPFAIALVLFALSFTNKRKSSDFYHSIPINRECTFNCYFAAVLTWIVLNFVVSTVVSILPYLCMPAIFSIDFADVGLQLLNIFAMSFLLISGISLAIEITGNMFSNIAVSALLLFFPRAFIGIVSYLVIGSNSMLTDRCIPSILSPSTNVLFSGIGKTELLVSCIYSIVLAIIYYLLAQLAFKKRKSESATKAAPNRAVQGFYRIAFTLFCSLLPIGILYETIVNEQTLLADVTIIPIVICYVAIVFAYFLFELISTKTPKTLLKVIPTFAIVVVLNIAVIMSMCAATSYAKAFLPSGDEIQSIRILGDNETGLSSFYSNSYSYVADNRVDYISKKTADIEITDRKACNEIAMLLQENSTMTENELYNKYSSGKEGYVASSVFAIKVNGKERFRSLSYPGNEYFAFKNAVIKSPRFKNVYSNLPKFDNSFNIEFNDSLSDILSNSDEKELYTCFANEISELTPAQAIERLSSYDDGTTYPFFSGRVTFTQQRTDYAFNFSFGKNTPKTTKKYYELINKISSEENKQKVINLLNKIESEQLNYLSVEWSTTGNPSLSAEEDKLLEAGYIEFSGVQTARDTAEFISKYRNEPISTDSKFIIIKYENYFVKEEAINYLLVVDDFCDVPDSLWSHLETSDEYNDK